MQLHWVGILPMVVKYLLEHGADPNIASPRNWTPLYSAAARNALEVAKVLIDNGAEVNTKADGGVYSPLLIAAYNNSVPMVELLLEAGADTSARLSHSHRQDRGLTALELAQKQGHEEIVALLLRHSRD